MMIRTVSFFSLHSVLLRLDPANLPANTGQKVSSHSIEQGILQFNCSLKTHKAMAPFAHSFLYNSTIHSTIYIFCCLRFRNGGGGFHTRHASHTEFGILPMASRLAIRRRRIARFGMGRRPFLVPRPQFVARRAAGRTKEFQKALDFFRLFVVVVMRSPTTMVL